MLEEINKRLKAGRVGVRVEQRGERLYLVATLPPRPDSLRTRPHQQRISLGIKANPAGFKRAELEAKKLGIQLTEGTFTWEISQEEELTVSQAIAKFEQDYFSSRERTPKSETTFNGYRQSLSKLPSDAIMSPALLIKAIESIPPNTRSRAGACQAARLLCRSIGIEVDLAHRRGNYGMARVNPRNIPSDAEIQAAAKLIPNSSWFWAYGMMATFGLRNHELFFINHELLISDGICEVTEGKTTGGKVWPLYPEWLDYFDLRSIRVPAITSPNHKGYGHAVGKAFRRYGVPFSPYCLRHAWARRAIEMGLDSRLASKQMRHSHSVHVKIYNAWLDDSIHQRAFERILDDKNRPKPPIG